MLPKHTAKPLGEDLCLLDGVKLFHLCATDHQNTEAWTELLRRYASKIRYFISGTLRQFHGYSAFRKNSTAIGGIQECDLFQNAIIRLVKNGCIAMKRFSGKSEDELLAYLAVICRSSVLDALRRNGALKRQASFIETKASGGETTISRESANYSGFEREILANELLSLINNAIESHSGNTSNRDRLVFELYFLDGLSYSQIARCRGINLSKAGVEKLLKRLMGRVQTLVSSGKSGERLQ